MTRKIRSVGILGAGTMGHGIAEVVALAGFDVTLYDVQQSFLDAGIEKIRWSVSKLSEKGVITKEKSVEVLGRVSPTLELGKFAGVDLVIEAAPEDLATKAALFSQLGQINESAIFASNTSTIPITEIAASVRNPERFVGLHFFNPPVIMPLVEVTRGARTSQETLDDAITFARQLGKQVVTCNKDVPGFIVNRILGPLLNEAGWTVTRGEATIAEIDSAAVYKAGLPMGLFELADYSGIDVFYKAAQAVNSRDPSAILRAPLFKEKFEQGKFGKKTGEGFYVYSGNSRPTISKEAGAKVDPLSFFCVAINAAAWLLRNEVCSREDLDLSVKWHISDEKEGSKRPGLGASLNIELPTGDATKQLGSGVADYYLNGIAQKSLPKKNTLRVNGGVYFAGNPATGVVGVRTTTGFVFTGAASVVHDFTEKLDLGVEFAGAGTLNDLLGKGQLQTQIGGNYKFRDKWSFDFGFIAGFYRDSPRFAPIIGIEKDF